LELPVLIKGSKDDYPKGHVVEETISGYRRKVVAGIVAAALVATTLGIYLTVYFPSQSTQTVGGGLTVVLNKVVAVNIPGFQYSLGIWQLNLANSGTAPLHAAYQIFVNGSLGYGNSTNLQPGEQVSLSSCLVGPVTQTTSFDVPIFVTNSTGTVVPHYPVTVVTTTQDSFSGQFSASYGLQSNVFDQEFQRNVSNWSIKVTNTGNKPIQFVMATLWNGSSLIASTQLRCAGSVPSALPEDYGQPLAPGQTANETRTIISATAGKVISGESYKAELTVVYADNSQVTQTSEIQSS